MVEVERNGIGSVVVGGICGLGWFLKGLLRGGGGSWRDDGL